MTTAHGGKSVVCCRLGFHSFSLRVSAWLQYTRLLRRKYSGELNCVCSRKAALPHLGGVKEERNGTVLAPVGRAASQGRSPERC